MQAIDDQWVHAVVTEDLSRISRDFADSALIFKRLQFAQVPLIGIADGIDTSSKNAKLSYTVKSLVADLYLDDLRDKTLRGLEGRAVAGYATGNTPYGYHTTPEKDRAGNVIGHRIEIDASQAAIIRTIFTSYCQGTSLAEIAKGLNRDGIPSPRVGTRHKHTGWGTSTIRAILYNDKYSGIWKFKQRQWVKIPGTNRRMPRPRDPSEVISSERPELRIIGHELWEETHTRLAAVKRKYTKQSTERVAPRGKRSTYLLSGLLVCGVCDAPLTIHGSGKYAYYRCFVNRTKGTCTQRISLREDIVRQRILTAIEERLRNPEAIAYVRKRIAEQLGGYSRKIAEELKQRTARLARTEDRIRGLIAFVADGDRSEYVVATLRDLEAHARADKLEISGLKQELDQPIRLPSIEEITHASLNLRERLMQDPVSGRMQLQRWLGKGEIRIRQEPDGSWIGTGELLPLVLLTDDNQKEKGAPKHTAEHAPGQSCTTFVAGARNAQVTTRYCWISSHLPLPWRPRSIAASRAGGTWSHSRSSMARPSFQQRYRRGLC